MPAIKRKMAGKQLEKDLQDVLNTKPNEWNYFFSPHKINAIFAKLADQIQRVNFFTEDYSINKFLDFLKVYVKAEFTFEKLKLANADIIRKFNQVSMTLQTKILAHTPGLNESQQKIVSNYLNFLHQLMEHEHRSIFDKSEIKLGSTDIQAIGAMLTTNSVSITTDLIVQYISLLKLSFDVPKLLIKYEVGLNILPLAKTCFLNQKNDVNVVVTQFFYILGYQGQLLDYYKNHSRFNITNQLLAEATDELKQKALDLQQYFFNHLRQRNEIGKPLLQHYLYIQFFKVIYKEKSKQLAALKTDPELTGYIKFDYVALPNSLECPGFPDDYRVRIEFDHLPVHVPKMACEAIQCSQRSNENWKRALKLHLSKYKSYYIYRVANSYKEYPVTFAYGYPPTGSGFYISKGVINQAAYGEGYSYWGNDTHNFIDVSRHEARHHDNYVLTTEAFSINPNIVGITVKSPNEGIAVNANGPCYPGHIEEDLSNVAAPTVPSLLEESFIGYFRSWLYTNYLIQERPDFYREILTLDEEVFKKRWEPILNRDQQHFLDWLPYLKQVCQGAPKELSLENCPSIFLNDYLPAELKNPFITTTSHRSPRQTMPQIISRTTATVRSSKKMPVLFTRPVFYDDYLFLMYAIKADNVTAINRILYHTNYSITSIVNFRDPERGLETPLHFLFAVYQKDCPDLIIETLCRYGAWPELIDNRNKTAYMMAENCDNWPKIKTLFDNQIQNLTKKTENHETGLIPYQQKNLALTISIPISALVSGVISGTWEEVTQRNSRQSPYLPNVIFYGLEPASLAMSSAIMNTLVAGPAEAIGLEDVWLSFAYYLGINYFGMLLAQLGEKVAKKNKNKLLNILMPVLLYTFFLNPSLIITLMSEGFRIENLPAVMMPLLSMISSGILFKAGEYSTKKIIGKFFPENSAVSANDSKRSYLGYSLGGTPQDMSSELKTLEEIQIKMHKVRIKIEKYIDPQAYQLNFKNNFESAGKNVSTLLNKKQPEGNLELDIFIFNELEQALVKIQQYLSQLSKGKNIKNIWEEISGVLVSLRGIRPLPQVNNSSDGVLNHMAIKEEQRIPLMTTFINRKNNNHHPVNNGTPRYTQTLSLFGRISTLFNKQQSDFPEPPTEQELREMEVKTNGNYSPKIV